MTLPTAATNTAKHAKTMRLRRETADFVIPVVNWAPTPVTLPGLSTPIRVALILKRLNNGGPSIQAIELSVRLRSLGFETTLVFGTLDPHEGDMTYLIERGQSRPESVSIPTLQRKRAPSVDVRALWKVSRLLCEVKPAIIHTHMAKAGALGRAAALAYNETVGRAAPARVVH